jgi:hypothetical protein
MAIRNRFKQGSGAYVCRICARRTRATGRNDNEHTGLCAECYELAGIENAFLDGHGTDNDIACAREYKRDLEKHGVTEVEKLFDDIPWGNASNAQNAELVQAFLDVKKYTQDAESALTRNDEAAARQALTRADAYLQFLRRELRERVK